jgi:hypothetical protein
VKLPLGALSKRQIMIIIDSLDNLYDNIPRELRRKKHIKKELAELQALIIIIETTLQNKQYLKD